MRAAGLPVIRGGLVTVEFVGGYSVALPAPSPPPPRPFTRPCGARDRDASRERISCQASGGSRRRLINLRRIGIGALLLRVTIGERGRGIIVALADEKRAAAPDLICRNE